MVKGDSTYRFITDHLGSVRLVVNVETRAVAQRIDYDEFGNVLLNTNPGFQPFAFFDDYSPQMTIFLIHTAEESSAN